MVGFEAEWREFNLNDLVRSSADSGTFLGSRFGRIVRQKLGHSLAGSSSEIRMSSLNKLVHNSYEQYKTL